MIRIPKKQQIQHIIKLQNKPKHAQRQDTVKECKNNKPISYAIKAEKLLVTARTLDKIQRITSLA